jgi:hypothetical protein
MPGFQGLTDDEIDEVAANARRSVVGDSRPDIRSIMANVPEPTRIGDVGEFHGGLTDDEPEARSDVGITRIPGTPIQPAPRFDLGSPMPQNVVARANTPQSATQPLSRPTVMGSAATFRQPEPDPWEVDPQNELGTAVASRPPRPQTEPTRPVPFAPPEIEPDEVEEKGKASPSRPGQFGATAEEQRRLQQARRMERGARITQAVMQGLGGIVGMAGLASGNVGAGAAGAAISGASRGLNALQGRSQEIQGDIDTRLASEGAERTYNDQQAAGQQASQRQAMQDQRQATLDEANLGLTRARTEDLAAERANNEFEQAALQGNAQGMRAAIRSRISAVQHEGTRQGWSTLASEGSELDQMTDLDALRSVLDNVARTDIRRGGQGAGGSGGGGGPTVDAMGNPVAARRHGSGGGSGSGPLASPTAPEAVDPILARMRQVRPDLSYDDSILLRAYAMENGVTAGNVGTVNGTGILQSVLSEYDAASPHDRVSMFRTARNRLSRDLNPERLSNTVDPIIYTNRIAPKMAEVQSAINPFIAARGALARAIRTAGSTPQGAIQLRAALNGDAATAQALGVPNLNSMMALGDETYGRAQSGAAISPSEWANFRRILGHGTVFNDPSVALTALDRMIALGEGLIDDRGAVGGSPAYAAEFRRQRRLAAEARRSRR